MYRFREPILPLNVLCLWVYSKYFHINIHFHVCNAVQLRLDRPAEFLGGNGHRRRNRPTPTRRNDASVLYLNGSERDTGIADLL